MVIVKVSVAIITWNRKDRVLRAIESVYKQPYRPIEVVVADSASTDGTVEAIEQRFPEVKTVRLHENLGCPGGRNIAMANCSGDIIISLDDDAWFSKGLVEGCVQRFQQDPELEALAFNIVPPGSAAVTGEDKETTLFVGCAFAIRKKCLDDLGYFPSDFFRQAEETDLAFRLIDAGYKIMSCPSLTIYHEACPVNRNAKKFMFYSCRNELSIVVRCYPLGLMPLAFLYKALIWNIAGLKNGALRYTVFGTLAGIWHIPGWLTRRAPVSLNTIRKFISFSKRRSHD